MEKRAARTLLMNLLKGHLLQQRLVQRFVGSATSRKERFDMSTPMMERTCGRMLDHGRLGDDFVLTLGTGFHVR